MPIRRATIAEVPRVFELVKYYADRREMLPRTLSELYEQLRSFLVFEQDGRVLGCARLHIAGADLGEVKSLAVDPAHVRQGIGRSLVQACLADARDLGLRRVFTLTYQPAFFRKVGFHDVQKSRLPQKIWNECIRCPEYPSCGEVPLWTEVEPATPPEIACASTTADSGS